MSIPVPHGLFHGDRTPEGLARLVTSFCRTAGGEDVPTDLYRLTSVTLEYAASLSGQCANEGGASLPDPAILRRWVFGLVGYLKAPDGRKPWHPSFGPLCLVFIDALVAWGALQVPDPSDRKLSDWFDPDAAILAFEYIWERRRWPKTTDSLSLAVVEALAHPAGLDANRYVDAILTLARVLQRRQPERCILIPVNDATAKALGMSLMTLSNALRKCIKLGYIHVVDSTHSRSGRARKLWFSETKTPPPAHLAPPLTPGPDGAPRNGSPKPSKDRVARRFFEDPG